MDYDYSIPGFIVLCGFMIALATVSVSLRFWSRCVVLGGAYGLDDWLALASMPPAVFVCVCGLVAAANHLGQDGAVDHVTSTLMMIYWIASIGFCIGIGLPKLSMLAFYARLFGLWRGKTLVWKITFAVTTFVTLAWTIGETLIPFVACRPLHYNWDPRQGKGGPGTCISQKATMLEGPVVSLINDFMILLLPLPEIYRLQYSKRARLWIAIGMTLGYSVALLCVGRVVFVAKSYREIESNFSHAILPVSFWIVAEPSSLVLAVSAFPIAQLIDRAWHFGIRSLFDTRPRSHRARVLQMKWSDESISAGKKKGAWEADPRLLCMSSWGTTTADIISTGKPTYQQGHELDSDSPSDFENARAERIKVDMEIRVNYEYAMSQKGDLDDSDRKPSDSSDGEPSSSALHVGSTADLNRHDRSSSSKPI